MLRLLLSVGLCAACLTPLALHAQTEIPGTVTGVQGESVTIAIPGDLLPRVGDEVRLRFRDPVEGVGIVFLEGTWEVSQLRRDEVVAAPAGDVAEPQTGLVAVIASNRPQAKADFTPPMRQQPTPAPDDEPAIAAQVADDDDVETIDRRRWFNLMAGFATTTFEDPAFGNETASSSIRPRMFASATLFLLPNVGITGFAGSVKVEADEPVENGFGSSLTPSAQEIYKGVALSTFFGTPGNVPGDVTPFLQAGYAWSDVTGSGPDTRATGFWGSAGLILTIKREFGLFISGQYSSWSYEGAGVIFDRRPYELAAGASVTLG